MQQDRELGNKAELAALVSPIDSTTKGGGKQLNSDKVVVSRSRRLRRFALAMRRVNAKGLHQLTIAIRAAIRLRGLPEEFLQSENARAFMDEEFVDNFMAYVSTQVMRNGRRVDGWHSDGGPRSFTSV